jgi:hypothetical protein
MSNRVYVGLKRDGNREPFWSNLTPEYTSHGRRYTTVTGPFSCVDAAEWFCRNNWGTTVTQANAWAKKYKTEQKAKF